MDSVCSSCRLPKAHLICECCQASVCKKCSQVLRKDSFSFLNPVPTELTYRTYCGACFDEKVVPALDSYESLMEKAKNVIIFFRSASEETRLIRRSEKPMKITEGSDRDETILRLAFMAAQAGFNALLDVEVTPEKVRNRGYQTTKWQAFGIPTNVDQSRYK